MIALWIILAVLALLILLLLVKVTVRISYCRDIRVTVKYLFLEFCVLQKDLTAKNKEEKKAEHKKTEKKKEKKKKKKPEKELVRPPLSELLPAAEEAVKKVLKRLGKTVRLEHARLRCCAATDDPSKTAIVYGAVSAAAGNIFVLLKSIKRRSHKGGSIDFKVEPDFIAEDFDLDLDIALSARPLIVIFTAIVTWFAYRKVRSMWKEKDENKNENNEKTEENKQ